MLEVVNEVEAMLKSEGCLEYPVVVNRIDTLHWVWSRNSTVSL